MRWRKEGWAVLRSGSVFVRRDQPMLLSELRKADSLAADIFVGGGAKDVGSDPAAVLQGLLCRSRLRRLSLTDTIRQAHSFILDQIVI